MASRSVDKGEAIVASGINLEPSAGAFYSIGLEPLTGGVDRMMRIPGC